MAEVAEIQTKIRQPLNDYGVNGTSIPDEPVFIVKDDEDGRWYIKCYNEGGFNFTLVDLLDVGQWIKDNPTVLE